MAKNGKPDTEKTVKSVGSKISLRVRKQKAYLSPGISAATGFMGEPTLTTLRER